MKKVLVLTVGGSIDPVVHAIENTKPSFTFFICSGGENKDKASYYKVPEIVKETDIPEDIYQVFTLNDPDGLNDVYSVCTRIDQIIQDRWNEASVIANYTGGTKTMSLGLGMYAIYQQIQGRNWKLQLNQGERHDLVKVKTGDLSQMIDPGVIHAAFHKSRVSLLEKNYFYDAGAAYIKQVLSESRFPDELEEELKKACKELECRAAWDRFDYAKAEANAQTKKEKSRLSCLQRIHKFFDEKEPEPWGEKDVSGHELIEDLIENAERCAKRQRYDDAIGRLYRATELIGQIKLLRDYHIRTCDVDRTNTYIPQKTWENWLNDKKDKKEKVKIGLMENFRLLKDMDDPLGRYWNKHHNDLKKFSERRNHSFFAHGLQSIDKTAWSEFGKPWIEWLKAAIEVMKR